MGLVTRSLFLALGGGKGGIELSHGLGHDMPGNEWTLVAGLPLPKVHCHSKKSLSLTVDGL